MLQGFRKLRSMQTKYVTLNGLNRRARTVLCDAVYCPVNIEQIECECVGRLTRRYLLAMPNCGPTIADEIINWPMSQGLAMRHSGCVSVPTSDPRVQFEDDGHG